jgi:2-phospho-L-lactate guanylyltransferase
MTVFAIVPLKSPEAAKSRLSTVLSPSNRERLFFLLARHVIEVLRATPQIDRIIVVTSNPRVEAFATDLGVCVSKQSAEIGTAAAFVHAISQLTVPLPARVLMIAGDLPLLSVSAVQVLIAASCACDAPSVVIAPDCNRAGTNALICAPPNAIAPCFGVDSFKRHVAAARRAKVEPYVIDMMETAVDLDVATDLNYLSSKPTLALEKFLRERLQLAT